MNYLIAKAHKLAIILPLFIFIPMLVMGHTSPESKADYTPTVPKVSQALIEERLNNLSSVIDIQYTDEVGKRIKEYTVNYRIAGERILGRIDMYFPLFDEQISRRNIPEELKYVAVVESHLDQTARSKSGAVGLWQFIKSTAKLQGLQVDEHIDERRDILKSTKAALDYLTDLYFRYEDWTLAIAAYNCGPGGVNKAIRRSGSRNYWGMRSFLPRETQKYVPRVIAAMYLMQYYHDHNLVPQRADMSLNAYTAIRDGKPHNLQTLSAEIGVPYDKLYELNYQYLSGRIPKNDGHLVLKIPSYAYDRYLETHDIQRYKHILTQRKEEELLDMREELPPLQPIEALIYSAIRQIKRPKKYYKATFAFPA